MSERDGTLKQTERIAAAGGPGRGPGGNVGERADDFRGSARRLVRLLRPARGRAVAVFVMAALSVTATALGPWLLGKGTDIVFGGFLGSRLPAGTTVDQAADAAEARGEGNLADLLRGTDDLVPGQGIDFDALARVLLLVLVIYVVGAALSWVQGYLVAGVVQDTVRQMRTDVEDKVHRLPLSYVDRQPRGELLSRVTNDIDNVAQNLQQTMSQLLTALLTVVAVLSMMLWISPLLALIAVVTVPVSMFVTTRIMRVSQREFIAQWRRTGRLNSHVEESITGHELVNVFGRRAAVSEEFDRQNEQVYAASWKAQFVSGLIMPVMMLIGNLNYVAIAVVGGLRVTSGALTIGEVQAFIQYSRQFTQPLTQIASMANLLQSGVASAERVFELLDAPEEVPDVDHAAGAAVAGRAGASAGESLAGRAGASAGEHRVETTRGEVRFEDVSFSYDPDQPLIEHLSLVARPGQTVAIVGPTGAGKTTLVNLVLRFYELHGGRITLDGTDITAMPRADLRGRVGMVLQDAWLFEGTIRDNIAYGRPGATEAEIVEAARATYVDRFVRSLPEGYDTVVADGGGNLSAGEQQLVTIARAFLARPPLLILDEATSSVDTRTELLLQHAMAALRSDRTSFVIAHRLSTIRDADLILVMEEGRIVEQGGYEELVGRGGAFARLHAAQYAAAAVD
ncbi:ABC transporter ATP-binding protein/permease [Nocardioides panacisoli]|uniref:ABC transporter ATP-binding protein n=1 Tax=Nocardioides panacisoli TaxID=627624 RepID=UPI001C63B1A3|nr:ABC transporter ATP-binding protein [Nocardioides panacisoli]QYJ03878.1 ABC transporter ATP-binding protein/permease [Nocardioides panacisoli]